MERIQDLIEFEERVSNKVAEIFSKGILECYVSIDPKNVNDFKVSAELPSGGVDVFTVKWETMIENLDEISHRYFNV